MDAVKELKSGLTKRVIAIGLVVQLIMLLAGPWAGFNDLNARAVRPGQIWPAPALMIAVLTILFLVLMKLKVVKAMLTPQELVVLFGWIGTSTVVTYTGAFGNWTWIFGWPFATVINDAAKASFGRFMPGFWSPSESVLRDALIGGKPIPFGDWILPIAFWTCTAAIMILFTYSITLIMRKRWLEVERWEFPFARMATEWLVVSDVYPDLSKGKNKIYPLLIGAAIGLLWAAPAIINAYAPAVLPEVYRLFQTGEIREDLLWYAGPWNQGVNIDLNANLEPWSLFMWILVPLDVLNTAVLASAAIYMVLEPVMTMLGMLPFWSWRDSYNTYWSFAYGGGWPWTQGKWNPIMPGVIFDVGGMIGLAIFTLWFSRGYIARTFKALTGPAPADLKEENEPVLYRHAWTLFIASGILLFVLFLIGFQAPLHVALIGLATMLVLVVAGARIRGEAGFGGFYMWYENTRGIFYELFGFSGWFQGPIRTKADLTSEFVAAENVQAWTAVENINFTTGYNSILLDAYKAGHDYSTNPKDILKGTAIGTVIALLLFWPILLVEQYSVGMASTAAGANIIGAPINFWFDPSYWTTFPPTSVLGTPSSLIQVVIGVVLMGLVMFARTMWIWFPLNPVGLILANSGIVHCWMGYLTIGTAAIAWLLKLLIFRFIGGKFYTERVQPFAAGWLAGWFLGLLIIAIPAIPWL